MITLKYILDKLRSLNKNTIVFILGALFVLLFLRQCNQISSLKQEIQQVQGVSDRNLNNYKASLDTITIERNSNSDLVSAIRGYELDVNNLTAGNKKLIEQYVRALNIKKETEKINSLIKADIEVKDSIIDAYAFIIQSKDTFKISVSDNKEWDTYNWRRFSGNVDLIRKDTSFSILSSKFKFDQGIGLQAAILDTDEGRRLKITSSYPGLEFTKIENINLVNDELNRPRVNKAGWSIGFGVGYGFNLNQGQILNIGPSIGVGVYWSPKWLRF